MKSNMFKLVIIFSCVCLGSASALSAEAVCKEGLLFKPISDACQVAGVAWSRPLANEVSFSEAKDHCSKLPKLNVDFRSWQLPTIEQIGVLRGSRPITNMISDVDNLFWVEQVNATGNRVAHPVIDFDTAMLQDSRARVMCAAEVNEIHPDSGWKDVTTSEDGAPSTCPRTPSRCILEQSNFRRWTHALGIQSRSEYAYKLGKNLDYGGSSHWHLPTSDNLKYLSKEMQRFSSIVLRSILMDGWLTEAQMKSEHGFWSRESPGSGSWIVNLSTGDWKQEPYPELGFANVICLSGD
ncbi:MAG: hypothetical protein NTV34_19910 [Proteobacteria bacterium]|nr:hypothetical protein [Pseudomonadota bacterium]